MRRLNPYWGRRPIVGRAAMATLVLALAAGCSTGSSLNVESAATGGTGTSQVDSAEPDPGPIDVVAEAGKRNPAGAFEDAPDDFKDQPPPPDSDIRVLCNLNASYISSLIDLASGDEPMSMSEVTLSLNDNIQVWESLVGYFPDTRESVDGAKRVLNLWHQAMAYEDSGDDSAAKELYRQADDEIEAISDASLTKGVDCKAS